MEYTTEELLTAILSTLLDISNKLDSIQGACSESLTDINGTLQSIEMAISLS